MLKPTQVGREQSGRGCGCHGDFAKDREDEKAEDRCSGWGLGDGESVRPSIRDLAHENSMVSEEAKQSH